MAHHPHNPEPMTRSACPGCKQGPFSYLWRPKDGVCKECATKLEEANAARAFLPTEKEPATITGAYHWLPYLRYANGRTYGPHGKPGDDFQKAFLELANLLGEGSNAPRSKDEGGQSLIPGQEGGYSSSARPAWFAAGVIAALRKVYAAAGQIALAAYDEGKHEGQGLLFQLASGEVSLDKFNERTLER